VSGGFVMGTGSGWPDLLVAAIMAALALSAGVSVVRLARQETTVAGRTVVVQGESNG
jgi:hypothetical protein